MRTRQTNPPRHEASDRHISPAAVGLVGAAGPARLLGAGEVAQVLGVPATFVYALARRGELPTVRIGERYVRFRSEALERWIAEQESTRPKGTR
jgi:excisionase family DNA binding protein